MHLRLTTRPATALLAADGLLKGEEASRIVVTRGHLTTWTSGRHGHHDDRDAEAPSSTKSLHQRRKSSALFYER